MLKQLLIIYFIGLFSINSFAQSYHVLLITGGRKMEKTEFLKMFDAFEKVEWEEAEQPEANRLIADHKVDAFDLLVFYDMMEPISDTEKAGYLHLLEDGKPMLFLHHSLVSYQNWPAFQDIIGGRYYDEKIWKGPILEKGFSTYRHDVSIPIDVVNPEHPCLSGLSGFTIYDEVYGNIEVLDKVSPLLTTEHSESERIIAWEHQYGASRIVYIMPGHGPDIFKDKHYKKLVMNAIQYLTE